MYKKERKKEETWFLMVFVGLLEQLLLSCNSYGQDLCAAYFK